MEFIKRKDTCPSCKNGIESSFLAGSRPEAIDQCWYFNCSACDTFYKSVHSNQKVFRNILYIIPVFTLGTGALISYFIGTSKSYAFGGTSFVLMIVLIFLYRKNAYGKLEVIEREVFNEMMERTEKQRIIQKHKKALIPQRLVLIVFYMAIYIAVMKYFNKW